MALYKMPGYITDITGLSANDYANSQTKNITDYNNQLMQQYEEIANNQKNALNLNKENAINQINNQRTTVDKISQDNSKQAYINKMLAQKDMSQTLSQSGLKTGGQSGTAYGSINNSYGENVNKINADRLNALLDLDNQVNSTNLTYASKEQDLLAEIANQKLNLQKYGTERYESQYQQAISNYMQFKDYEATLTNLYQQAEQIENSYKQQQFANDLALKNYNLALKKANSSSSNNNTYEKLLQNLLNSQSSSSQTAKSKSYTPNNISNVKANSGSVNKELNKLSLQDGVNFNKAYGLWK